MFSHQKPGSFIHSSRSLLRCHVCSYQSSWDSRIPWKPSGISVGNSHSPLWANFLCRRTRKLSAAGGSIINARQVTSGQAAEILRGRCAKSPIFQIKAIFRFYLLCLLVLYSWNAEISSLGQRRSRRSRKGCEIFPWKRSKRKTCDRRDSPGRPGEGYGLTACNSKGDIWRELFEKSTSFELLRTSGQV